MYDVYPKAENLQVGLPVYAKIYTRTSNFTADISVEADHLSLPRSTLYGLHETTIGHISFKVSRVRNVFGESGPPDFLTVR